MGSGGKYVEFRVSRRSVVVGVVFLVVAGLVAAWVVMSSRPAVVTGSASSIGAGVSMDRCGPGGSGDVVVYPSSEDVVAVQTIRNEARWAVEVISGDPDVYRFGHLAERAVDDFDFPSPHDGAPDTAETLDRVVIPPGREVAMWIVDPFPEMTTGGDGYVGISRAPVTVVSLGVRHESWVDLSSDVWVANGGYDRERLIAALDAVCDELQ
jgi:hypothetical protein